MEMTLDIPTFRADFPAFADVQMFPDTQIQFWISFADMAFNKRRWGTWLTMAMELYVAHNCVMDQRAIEEAQNGDLPGTTTGAINSKSADKVSVGFDTASSTEEDGGHYNTTIYGVRLYRMIKMIGAGPVQVGVDNTPPSPLSSVNAWPGPWYGNFPNPSNS